MNEKFSPGCSENEGFLPNDTSGMSPEEYIINRFRATYRGIFNVIELALDENKAKTAKDIIGDILAKTRDDCMKFVHNHYSVNDKL